MLISNQYDVLMPGMLERIRHATSIMHAYAHQWECQLVFSPRMLIGAGLTDGEGSERLWSRLCALIPVLRHVSVSHHHSAPPTSPPVVVPRRPSDCCCSEVAASSSSSAI